MRCGIVVASLFVLAGCKKDEAAAPPVTPAVEEPPPPPAKPAPPTAAEPTPAPAAKPAAGGELPRAEDVLPPGEVSKGSLVVKGDGYRFQVRPEHKRVELEGGQVAYRGTTKGMVKPAELTLYVTREPFDKPLAALVERETKSVTDKAGKVSMSMPVKIKITGALSDAHRFRAKVGGKLDMRVMAVHDKTAFIFHCETPDVPLAWPNVGSDCMIRGSTFHVAP